MANYQKFVPLGVVFEYRTTSSEVIKDATDPRVGTVTMAWSNDPEASVNLARDKMTNMTGAQECKPSQNMSFVVPLDPRTWQVKNFQTYPKGNEVTGFTRFNAPGELFVIAKGQQHAQNIGELWVTYDIECSDPRDSQVITVPAALNGQAHYKLNASEGSNLYGVGITDPDLMTPNQLTIDEEAPVYPTLHTNSIMHFKGCARGVYQITFYAQTATPVDPIDEVSIDTTFTEGIQAYTGFEGGWKRQVAGFNTQKMHFVVYVEKTVNSNVFAILKFNTVTNYPSGTFASGDVMIQPLTQIQDWEDQDLIVLE